MGRDCHVGTRFEVTRVFLGNQPKLTDLTSLNIPYPNPQPSRAVIRIYGGPYAVRVFEITDLEHFIFKNQLLWHDENSASNYQLTFSAQSFAIAPQARLLYLG
jgi:hypothetical protein